MLRNVFSFFVKEEEQAPITETRLEPKLNLAFPEKEWVYSQVLIDKDDRNSRFYYGAYFADTEWHVKSFRWHLSHNNLYDKTAGVQVCSSFERAIQDVIGLERSFIGEGNIPVPHLKGNYREVANRQGGHIDDKGRYVAIDPKKPVASDMSFNRAAIDTLYAPDQKNSDIRTWDDYYRVVVNLYPVRDVISMPAQKSFMYREIFGYYRYRFDDRFDYRHESVMGVDITKYCKKSLVEEYAPGGVLKRLMYDSTMNVFAQHEDEDLLEACAILDHHMMARILTHLLREGTGLYQKFAASDMNIDHEAMRDLSKFNETVEYIGKEMLGLTAVQAQQVVALVMQGPDPYADQLLPMDVMAEKVDRAKWAISNSGRRMKWF